MKLKHETDLYKIAQSLSGGWLEYIDKNQEIYDRVVNKKTFSLQEATLLLYTKRWIREDVCMSFYRAMVESNVDNLTWSVWESMYYNWFEFDYECD